MAVKKTLLELQALAIANGISLRDQELFEIYTDGAGGGGEITTAPIVDNNWDLSGAARQWIEGDEDKTITVSNITESIKALLIIHTGVAVTFIVNGITFEIDGNLDYGTIIMSSVLDGTPWLNQSTYILSDGSTPPIEFPTGNRLGLWRMSTMIIDGSNECTRWNEQSGNINLSYKKIYAHGPTFDADGLSNDGFSGLYAIDGDGLTFGLTYTIYMLISKGAGNSEWLTGYAGPTAIKLNDAECSFSSVGTATTGGLYDNDFGVGDFSAHKVLAITYDGVNPPIYYLDGVVVGFFTLTSGYALLSSRNYGVFEYGNPSNGKIKGWSVFDIVHTPLQVAQFSPPFKILAQS